MLLGQRERKTQVEAVERSLVEMATRMRLETMMVLRQGLKEMLLGIVLARVLDEEMVPGMRLETVLTETDSEG